MSARAGIVVTGTEVLTGVIRDANGPWVAERLLELGLDVAHTTVCGDRPHDMEAQLRFMARQGVDLVVTTGGLGPTADDKTVEVVAAFAGRPLELDESLLERILAIVRPLRERWPDLSEQELVESARKQALVPRGARVIEPAGTAPGFVVPPLEEGGGPTVVVMPGPPRELRQMWPVAVASEEFAHATRNRTRYESQTLRLYGTAESEIAETLRIAEREVPGFGDVEITTCLRRGELEVAARWEPGAAEAWRRTCELIERRHGRRLFARDGERVDDQVAELLRGRRIALAESCTGGLLAARLTDRPGASEYVTGGAVVYSDRAKTELLGVDPALIERHGAVSPEVADAMADGALARFGADVAVAITGVAGPGGGTDAKPVGYVCFCAKRADGAALARDLQLPGDRAEVRDRSTTVAMHLLRRLLDGDRARP
ncbi:MAG: competence/damage-inducible protein A [Thermoleophilaceae bacterium]|nr:competence/damage-inducible protein A [Thermoleophilaceae bacterium]